MKYLYPFHDPKHLELDNPVEDRFAAFMKMVGEFNYTVFVQHCCLNQFDHTDYSLLTPDNMELLMKEAEQMIYEASVQLRLMK